MGKGYNNFMSKKPFHPASKDNIKRVWMAEQRTIDAKKKEDDMRAQYEKEQDLYNNRVMVAGSDSKDKLSLNFMYEAPAGLRKDTKETDEAEPEYKFEWQRNAPRESFAKNNMDIRDQPFGIQVRNVRCLKCHKWGHVNTDRECPLFNAGSLVKGSDHDHKSAEPVETTGSSKEQKPPPTKAEQAELIKVMKEEQGLALKRNLYGRYGAKRNDGDESNQEMLAVKDPEMAFLDSLSAKEKKKLLKKLQKITNAQRGIKDDGKVSKKKKKSKKHKKSSKKKSSKKRKHDDSDSDESNSDSSPEESEEDKKMNRSNGNRKRESNGAPIDNHNGSLQSTRKPIHRGRSPSPLRNLQRKQRSRSRSSRSPPPGRRPFNPKAGASQRIVPILRPMSPSERAQFVRENGFGRFGRRSPSRSRSRSPVFNRRSRSPINRLSRSPVNRRSRSPIGRISRSPLNRRSRSPSPRRIPANGWRRQSSLTRSRASPPRRGRRSPSNSPPRARRPRSPSPLNRRHRSRSSSPPVAPPLGSRSNSRSYSPSPPRRIPHGGRGPFADRYGLKAPPRSMLSRSPSPKRNAYRGRPSPPSRRFSPHRGPIRPVHSSINRHNRSRSGDRY